MANEKSVEALKQRIKELEAKVAELSKLEAHDHSSTPYDDVFRTELNDIPHLIIPMVRNCHEINFHFGLSEFAYASLSSVAVPRYDSFLRLAYADSSSAKIKSYFMTVPK